MSSLSDSPLGYDEEQAFLLGTYPPLSKTSHQGSDGLTTEFGLTPKFEDGLSDPFFAYNEQPFGPLEPAQGIHSVHQFQPWSSINYPSTLQMPLAGAEMTYLYAMKAFECTNDEFNTVNPADLKLLLDSRGNVVYRKKENAHEVATSSSHALDQ
ncbi:hypothetical protein FRC09_004360 [Ceratobasidium sp. 395]|nr:hypothetical protein FRC09_004360 [Ceratobasidium sp. 395]